MVVVVDLKHDWLWTAKGQGFESSYTPRFALCGLPNPTPTCAKLGSLWEFAASILVPRPQIESQPKY